MGSEMCIRDRSTSPPHRFGSCWRIHGVGKSHTERGGPGQSNARPIRKWSLVGLQLFPSWLCFPLGSFCRRIQPRFSIFFIKSNSDPTAILKIQGIIVRTVAESTCIRASLSLLQQFIWYGGSGKLTQPGGMMFPFFCTPHYEYVSCEFYRPVPWYSFNNQHSQQAYSECTSARDHICLLYTSPSPRDLSTSRMPSSA